MTLSLKNVDLRHMAQLFTLLGFPIAITVGKAALDSMACLITFLFLVHVVRTKNWQVFNRGWIKAGLAFWGWQIASALWAYNPWLALQAGFIWGRFFIFGVALAYWILPNDAKFQKQFFFIIAFYLFFLGGDSLIQYYFRVDLLGNEIGGSARLTGPFKRPIVGTSILYFFFPVLAYALCAPITSWKRAFCIGSSIACISAIILSGERSPLMLLLLGFALTCLSMVFMRRVRMLLIFTAATAAVLTLQFTALSLSNQTGAETIKNRQIGSVHETVTNFAASPYGLIWQDAWDMIRAHPLLGVGAKNIKYYWCDLGNQRHFTENCPLHPHNTYIEILASFGTVGMALYLLAIACVLREFYNALPRWKNDPIVAGILITVLVRLWPLIITTSHTRSPSAFSFWLMVGWGIALIESAKDKRKETTP